MAPFSALSVSPGFQTVCIILLYKIWFATEYVCLKLSITATNPKVLGLNTP